MSRAALPRLCNPARRIRHWSISRHFVGRDPVLIEKLLEAAAQVLAAGLGLEPGNVFVTWTELQPGRVFTGGAVRR